MSENKRDYYEVLGVTRDASEKQIKRAYREKAMKLHPDKYDGPKEEAEEKFKEVNEAYSILSDPQQRQMYDQFGFAGVEGAGQSARQADPFDFFSQIFNFDLGDIFGGGFGSARSRRGRRQRSGPSRGDDVILDLELTYEEVYEGVKKKITMPFNSICKECQGTRSAKGSSFVTCKQCRGTGTVEKQESRGFFVQISRQPCSNCNGSGRIPEKKCQACNGTGRSNKREEIKISIPRGINEGEAVRVQGKGRPSNDGGMPGDLIFRIHLKDHDKFERNNLDVYTRLPVNYPTMVLGGEMTVNLISGKNNNRTAKLKIPPKTKINDVLTLKNQGFVKKASRGGGMVKGDMNYVVTLDIPNKLTKKQKQLLKELKEEMN